MTPRPTRVLAGALTLLIVAGVTVAGPADAAKPKRTKTVVTSGHAVAGAKVTLTATVKPRPSGGTVRFVVSGKTPPACGKVAVRKGKARCTTMFATAGKRAISAKYSGKKGKYRASSGRRPITVAAKPVKQAAPRVKAGTIVGGTGACTTSKGALVAVSFAKWSGPVVRGCDTTPTKGNDLLTTAGFTLAGTKHDGPAFICRIGHPLFNSGTQYPTPSQDACVLTPPASAYWSYWLAAKGQNTWTYAKFGAYSQPVANGDVQAWTFGATDVNGTTGKPTFTPNQIRAGMTAKRTASAARLAAGVAPADRDTAVKYLTDNLVDGTHYEPFGAPDYGLTIDSALALAATGADDATLRKIVDYIADNQNDYTYLDGELGDFVGGGSVGKVALLAEATGYDPNDFGDVQLIDRLIDLICTATDVADDAGKSDAQGSQCRQAGNYRGTPSVFGQSLAVIAQVRAGTAAQAKPAVDFLASLQTPRGGFPSQVADDDADETDSTAMAAMALDLAGDTTAADHALEWLVGKQTSDGGFPGAAGNSTNSAALAVLGLSLAGSKYGDQIDKAERFLAGAQNGDGGFDIAADQDGSDVRASAQVVSALVGTPFSTLLDDVSGDDPPQPSAAAGAKYLVGQLVGGNRLESTFGNDTFVDYGGTADLAIALAATGTQQAALVRIVRYLRGHVADYVDPAGTTGGPYIGSAGKLATLASITGQDATDFGGTDLLALIANNVCTAASTEQFGPCSAAGDFRGAYSGVGQVFGVLGLARAGAGVPPAALSRLLDLQCAGGGFSSVLLTANATCTPDVDTTGFAIQALTLLGTTTARDAVHNAVAYLRSSQNPDGSWPGAAGDNTNSTALGVQGLLAAPASADFPSGTSERRVFAAPSDPQVKRARAFLATLQNGNGGFGISAASPGSDPRATSQVVPAVANATLSTLRRGIALDPTSPPGSGGSSGPNSPGSDGAGANGGGSPVSAAGGTADTGAPVLQLLALAFALLFAGAAMMFLTRRRTLVAMAGRHRCDR